VAGFVNGDTSSVLSGAPPETTTAVKGSRRVPIRQQSHKDADCCELHLHLCGQQRVLLWTRTSPITASCGCRRNTMTPADSPLYLIEATGTINDQGQIASVALQISGGEVHGFPSTPTTMQWPIGESPRVILPENVRSLVQQRHNSGTRFGTGLPSLQRPSRREKGARRGRQFTPTTHAGAGCGGVLSPHGIRATGMVSPRSEPGTTLGPLSRLPMGQPPWTRPRRFMIEGFRRFVLGVPGVFWLSVSYIVVTRKKE
jgi:hypothetical protein